MDGGGPYAVSAHPPIRRPCRTDPTNRCCLRPAPGACQRPAMSGPTAGDRADVLSARLFEEFARRTARLDRRGRSRITQPDASSLVARA
jgi:hypothetical protein